MPHLTLFNKKSLLDNLSLKVIQNPVIVRIIRRIGQIEIHIQ